MGAIVITRLATSALMLLPGLAPAGSSDTAEFVGSTPCGELPRQFIGIAAAAECERITWQLTLSPDRRTFSLRAVHGMSARNDPGFVDGGTEARLQGTWSIGNAMDTERSATVYRLTTGRRALEFALIGNNLLHPLDDRHALMVGNASWSYTLSRTNAASQAIGSADGALSLVSATSGSSAATVAGVFEGRTPCQAVAAQLHIRASRECFKMKWRLTLYVDAASRAAGGYKLEASGYRNPPRTGRWAIRTSPGNGSREVLQLDPSGDAAFLSFHKADDNLLLMLNENLETLVGDIYFSYTLNRTR